MGEQKTAVRANESRSMVRNENRVTVKSDSFAHGPTGLSLRPIENFSADDLWSLISNLTQSTENFQIDDSFVLQATFVEIPQGTCARGKVLTIDSVTRRSLVSIQNTDSLFLLRALLVGAAYVTLRNNDTTESRSVWKAISDGRRKAQKENAEDLVRLARVSISRNGCSINELEKFQQFYADRGIAIVVFDKDTFGSGESPFFDDRARLEEAEIEI